MKKVIILALAAMLAWPASADTPKKAKNQPVQTDREYWVDVAWRISQPILEPMSRGELHSTMPMQYSSTWDGRDGNVAWMEAFGRLMAGISPWLALPDDNTPEGAKRAQMRDWALKSYANAVDPESPDYLGWRTKANQVMVDASYLANSLLRAPALWEQLDERTRQRYIDEFKGLRRHFCWYSNWMLFRPMIEAFLLSVGEEHDGYALRTGLTKVDEWYVGDGWYSDGPDFAMDYYNSFVIHTYMVECVEAMAARRVGSPVSFDLLLRRMQRYNTLLERMISPEGTFPTIGRSITYRMAAFQPLALAVWKYGLPENLTNGGVRAALTAVMRRMFDGPQNFDEAGYLRFGFNGDQSDVADYYTNTGSLYITSLVFLPLGLSADAEFWTAPAEKWTSQRAWGGEPFHKDYHQSIRK